MEPEIIQYYNELPSYAIVINNLNQEYDELLSETQEHFKKDNYYEKKYHKLKDELTTYKREHRKIDNSIIFLILFLGLYIMGFITFFRIMEEL